MALKTLKHIYQNNKDFEKTDHSIIEQLTNQLKQEFTGLYQQNSLYIRAKVRDRFERHMELSNKALTQLNNEEKEFKKEYAEGRKILENEFSKTMRYKSIRHLASKESGKVLSDLKPVWLMSPLSVSDSLPVDRSFFDVVIFDEASQIPLEDGVPALYRAPQTIVVGDDKQMPPTNFFNVRREDPDDLEQYTDEEDEWLSNDLESLLVQATKKLNNVMLGWHYRSRYETLINYSNHAFYSGNLLTIPDRVIHHGQKQAIEIKGSEDAEKFISALTDRSISFHHLTKGVYEKRVNEQEASYIAEMIRILLKGKIKDSIGIVAFSQEQQQAIEDALYRLSADDKEFEQLLEEAFNRTDHDQFTGLFVKNLENVQGDERDLIIMSICYGYDSKKRMIMNFGPVNKKGGEKRLNVIFSRAKKHMAVVSSITHSDITNEYNEGANYFKQFLNYAEQVSIGNMEVASRILDKLILRKSRGGEHPNKNIVRSQIKEELEKEGLEVAEEVGQSRFRCSLAVRVKPQDEFYALSILIDDEDHYRNENLLEQYYQRPDILKEFGWRTVLVFTKDWLHHPQKVMSDIKKILLEAGARLNPGEKSEIYFSEEAAALSTEKTSNYESLSYERLEYKEDNVDKFWEVAVDQQRLIIRSGRTGLKGQTIVRRFTTKEAAEGEMRKMLEEKRRKLQG
jgi:predicted DNA-binding WGR domain protein